jgi:hypothetical protein
MPTPTYYPIASVTANGSQTSVTLSGLGGYKNLFVRAYFRFTSAGNLIYINGSGAGVTHDSIALANGGATPTLNAAGYQYLNPGNNLDSVYGIANIYIPSYGDTSIFKSYYIDSFWDSGVNMAMIAGTWKSTSAITSIQFDAGTAFTNLSKFTAFGWDS